MLRKIQRISSLLVLFSLFSVSFNALPAQAALFSGSKDAACKGATASNSNCDAAGARSSLETTIANIINLLSIIVGIVAVILIIVNGFRFITSGGDSNAVASARNGIIFALVGLIIVALAQVIVRFVLQKVAP